MIILSKKMTLTSILLIFVTYALTGCGSATTTTSSQPAQTSSNASSSSLQDTAKTNTYGNTSGNLVNIGYVAQQGDWIYFSCLNDYGKTAKLADNTTSLYKMRTDGTEKTEMLNNFPASEINVIGDWIYYRKNNLLYKIRTDGTDETSISSNKAAGIVVVSDWIYYSNLSDQGFLYKIHTDGKEDTKLNNVCSLNINVVGDWIYYLTSIYDNNQMYYAINKIRTDGTNETKIISGSGNRECYFGMTVVGDWIYYENVDIGSGTTFSADTAETTLYKIRTDGTGGTELINDNTINLFNVNGDWIYCTDENNKIYKIHVDGTGNTKIEADNFGTINVLGDWIYYFNRSDSASLYRIRTDGTQNQKLQ